MRVARHAVLCVLATSGCGSVDERAPDHEDASTLDASLADASGDDVHFGSDAASDSAPPVLLVCPEVEPTVGAACVSRTNLCEYGTASNIACQRLYRCFGGQWIAEQSAGACPPSEACPSEPGDAACTSLFTTCAYPEAGVDCICGACTAGPPSPNQRYAWMCVAPGAACPLARPNIGTNCSMLDAGRCSYSRGGCCTGVAMECQSGVWVGGPTSGCP